ncbi:MAG: hypothetical protein ACRD2E_07720 [Terriglobales bacterium]
MKALRRHYSRWPRCSAHLAVAGILVACALSAGGASLPVPSAQSGRVRDAKAAMVQPAVRLYAESPVILRSPHTGREILQLELLNRGTVTATSARVFIEVVGARNSVIASESRTRYGLRVPPGGRATISVALGRLLYAADLGRVRYMVSVTGGTAATSFCRNTAAPKTFCPATVRDEPLSAANVETGPASQRLSAVPLERNETPRPAAAMVQPAALLYARAPVVRQNPSTGNLLLRFDLVNRGAAPATAARIGVVVVSAARNVAAGESLTRYGLHILPGGREVVSIALAQIAAEAGAGRQRYVVFVTGGTSTSIWWKDMASPQQFDSAAVRNEPLSAESIETGPVGQRTAPWEGNPTMPPG